MQVPLQWQEPVQRALHDSILNSLQGTAVKLLELLDQQDYSTAYYDPAGDVANVKNMNDTRRPTLTLKHLNRLKRIRALRKLEDLKRQDLLGIMYSIPDESAMGGGLGGLGGPGGF